MINLLPFEEKKKLLTEYRLRLGVTVMFALAALVGSGLILLSPSYVLALMRANYTEKMVLDLESKVKRAVQEKQINTEIAEVNRKIEILNSGRSEHLVVSEVVKKLMAIRPATIKISGIMYDPGVNERIMLTGVARDRESLASFIDTLHKDNTFNTVNLPISSYVKSKDIDFSIALERNVPVKK